MVEHYEEVLWSKVQELEIEMQMLREKNLSHIMSRLENVESHVRGVDLRTQIFCPKRVDNE